MLKYSRKEFLKTTGAGIAGAATLTGLSSFDTPKKEQSIQLGIASYTFKEFELDQALSMTTRLGIKNIALKDFHLPRNSSPKQLKNIAEKIKIAGINLYGGGVIYINNETEMDEAFEYAKNAGLKTIIGVPALNLLQYAEAKVKQYDIVLAIHNHGPEDKLYPSPDSIYEKVKGLDKRIGLCIDIGHTFRMNMDPAEKAQKFADRLYDVHLKDVIAPEADSKVIEMGRGSIDIPKFLKTLKAIDYRGIASFEFEKDMEEPLPGLVESVGYTRGVLSVV